MTVHGDYVEVETCDWCGSTFFTSTLDGEMEPSPKAPNFSSGATKLSGPITADQYHRVILDYEAELQCDETARCEFIFINPERKQP